MDGGNVHVFFISLVASSKKGIPNRLLHIFDYLTAEVDLKHMGVETINTTRLLDYFNDFHPTYKTIYYQKKNQIMKKSRSEDISKTSEIDVYQLVQFFIGHTISRFGENAAFIIDECPILSRHDNQGK